MNNFNWQKLAKKGEIERDVRKRLVDLKNTAVSKILISELILKENGNLSNESKGLLNTKFDKIISDYSIFAENEIQEKKTRFYLDLEKELDFLINKKALCSIEFDGYALYSFFKALSSLLDEIEIEIKKDKLYILTMDPLRISTIEIIITNKNFKFYNVGKIGFNLSDLQKVFKCKSGDNSIISLIFGKEKVFITIKSKKYKSQIERELNCIDYHQSGKINIDQLHNIEYSCRFDLSKEKLGYLVENFGIYSQIIKIKCWNDKVSFIESGDSGSNEISWDHSLVFIFNDQERSGGIYSLDFFNMNYKMANLLNNSDHISFSIKEKYPLKSEIKYAILGDFLIRFYISPRN